MPTIEGWPYATDPKRGKDLQTKYHKAERALVAAEKKMRRAFNAWDRARAAHQRIIKQLEEPTKD